jgi:hypothetical protein
VLDSHMSAVDSNIELSNQHVKEIVAGLQAGGATDELVVNLFKYSVLSVIFSSHATCATR